MASVYRVVRPRSLHRVPARDGRSVKNSKPPENAELEAQDGRWVDFELWVLF
eukprot:SAG31_NODE_47143_length_251_cov_1.026316_1_plen_51_part_01